MRTKSEFSIIYFCLLINIFYAQNENINWYFGNHAGLNFSTYPPITLTNNAMYSSEGCSTVSDANGNILFYTDGITIWNKAHLIMANGTGLMGHPSAAQSGLVVKQPGNPNLFYVFTVDVAGGTNGLRYTIVDMNLAAGMGSVTIKNTLLYTPCTEKLTAVKTSNGLDFWVVTHEWGSANFRSYKLTATGVNTTCAISTAGTIHGGSNIQNAVGCMKISPDGHKLGLAISNTPYNLVELFDFNTFNGLVSNQLTLQSFGFVYGVEFSPNSSKFYATRISTGGGCLSQWDLSSYNNTSIFNSVQNFSNNNNMQQFGMQLAPNGKIYVASLNSHSLSVIHDPDLYGAACGFSINAQSLGTANALIGLPAFVSMAYTSHSFITKLKDPNCSGHVQFISPLNLNAVLSNSAVSSYTVMGLSWNFDDSYSSNNTSNIYNPTHDYSAPGIYYAKLIISYSSGVNNDTLNNTITILKIEPKFKFISDSPVCERESFNFAVMSNSLLSNIYWSGPNNFASHNYSNTILNTTTFMSGRYKMNGSYSSSCVLSDSILLTVKNIPNLTPQSSTVCLNQEMKMIGTGADFYSWKSPTGDSSKLNPYQFYPNSLKYSGNYTLSGMMQNGCTASVTMNLFVSALPLMDVKIVPSNQICLNDVLTFITPNNLTTEWRGPNYFYTSKSDINFWANKTEMSGNYSLTLRNQLGCESKTIIPVIINNLPEIIVSGLTKPTCPPLNLNYEVLNKNNSLLINWEIANSKFKGDYLKYNFENPGNYVVKAKLFDAGSQCSNTFTYPVIVLPKTKADFHYLPLNPTENLDEINLINNSKYDINTEYNWDINSNIIFTNKLEPRFKLENAGSYAAILTTKNSYGCIDTCLKIIHVKPLVNLFAPTVFTPNHDELNEVFKPVLYGANPIRLCVFNRWGNKIFEGNDQVIEWDGNYENKACKEDTYYWKFEYQLENNIRKTETGVVLLMR